jgi:cholesterol oxidase
VTGITHYDVVVIGSGFGGSVAALRLSEKGYRVGLLEAGRRFADADLPSTSWDIKNFLWAPEIGMLGVQRAHFLDNVAILAGAGVGGGSLVYANTLYEPSSVGTGFYTDRQWADITDWRAELAPYYDQARRMMGVVDNPTWTRSDDVVAGAAKRLGIKPPTPTPVGVFFGRDGRKEPDVEVDDPFFGGAGPRRRGCIECGECMTGCKYNAKNTLVKNYLWLAERAGAMVHAQTEVKAIRPGPDGGWRVEAVRTGPPRKRRPNYLFTADQVIVAAGTWGTQLLLHTMKEDGILPHLSDRLGKLTRTNSEAIGGALATGKGSKDADFTEGIAITSSIHIDERSHLEPVRYGKGSNLMAFIQTVGSDPVEGKARWRTWVADLARNPAMVREHYMKLNRWSERTVIGLFMQQRDNSITVLPKRTRSGRIKLSSIEGEGESNPTFLPEAARAYEAMAQEIGGIRLDTVTEMLGMPLTAHFLGGCVIGSDPGRGVVDGYQRAYGYPGLHIMDGSVISANLGVNPSLTILAQAERAMAMWPNKGEEDTRPELGTGYVPVAAVVPQRPVVPADAPGALRLPLVNAG